MSFLRFSVGASGHILIVLICWFHPIRVEAQCLIHRFRCDSGKCISPHFVCDRDNDCGDGSDEKYCQSFTPYLESCRRPSHVRCLTGDCLVHSEYCSGSEACPNKDDLRAAYSCNCGGDQFQCLREAKCIHESLVCDGKPGCPDGSDEIPAVCASRPCASSVFKCVTNKTCITTDLLCNGRNDCGSGDTSDEEWPACRCNTTLASKVCKCPPGFRLESDSGGFKSCQDIDECSFHNSSLLCNHSCLNTEGGYRCTCPPGYVLKADGKNCESPLFLYQRQRHGTLVLTKLDFTSSPLEVSSQAMDGYDFDSHSKTVYWTSTSSVNGSLLGSRSIDTNKSDVDQIHYRDLDSPTLLAFDWVSGNVFVVTHTTDPEPESPPKIAICSVKESNNSTGMGMGRKGGCAKICNLQGMNDFPVEVTGLIVAPEYGYIFWAQVIRDNETENRNGSIWRARVDGSRISKLVSDVPNPTGLAMDYMFGHVYWVDSSTRTLESINFDGSNRTVLLRMGNNYFGSIQGLTVLGDQVIWFDNGNMIQCTISQEKLTTSSNLTTTNCTSLTNSELTEARFPKVLHPSLQPKSSDACTESPCSFICVVADIYSTAEDSTRDTTTSSRDLDTDGFRCLCPDEYIADDRNSFNCTHHTLTTTTIGTTKTTGIPWIPITPTPRSATCYSFQFKCTNGLCIRQEYVCDSDNDCGDFSDEVGCTSRTPTPSTTKAVTRPTPSTTTTTTTKRSTPRTTTDTFKATKTTTTTVPSAVTNDSGTKSSNHSSSSKSRKIIIIIIFIILIATILIVLKRFKSPGNSSGRNLSNGSYFRFQNRS